MNNRDNQSAVISPDSCFYIDQWQAVSGKKRIGWRNDPPPDLVRKIDVTSYPDVNDYLSCKVLEVWLVRQQQLLICSSSQFGQDENTRTLSEKHPHPAPKEI